MRTLIYKRTHSGDPDGEAGIFGNHDCMGSVRGWYYDAVIGIGGIGQEPESHGIAGKLTWVGIGPIFDYHHLQNSRGPKVRFQHFLDLGEHGPLLRKKYPALATRVYDRNVRILMHAPSLGTKSALDHDVENILRSAKRKPPSKGTARTRQTASSNCRAKSRNGC